MWTFRNSVIPLLLCLLLPLHYAASYEHVVRSKRDIFWKCSSNSDCTAKGSICVQEMCVCPTGYVYNTAMTSCLKVVNSIGEPCEESIQCSWYLLSGGMCVNNTCACGTGYHYLHGRCYKSIGLGRQCSSNDNCYVNADTEATSCNQGTCQCSEGFYQREYRTCRRAGKVVGDECAVDVDCVFKNGYCTSDYTCEERDNQTGSTYELPFDYANSLGSYAASVHPMEQKCDSNANCTDIGNSICSPLGTCVCDRAQFIPRKQNVCTPELGEPCKVTDKPLIRYSTCRDGKWSCNIDKVASKDNRECRKTIKQYGWSCLHDEQCYIFGPDAACVKKKCVCTGISRFIQDKLFCWVAKGIGESCQNDIDCYMEQFNGTLVCKNKVCSCPEGSHINSNGTTCVEGSADLGSDCEIDTDCATEDAICSSGKCTCGNHFYEEGGKCYRGIGATCADVDECTPKHSRCFVRTCQCANGYVSDSIKSCIPSVQYGDACHTDIQCQAQTENSECKDVLLNGDVFGNEKLISFFGKVCTCSDGYYYRFNSCYRKKRLGDSCSSLAECYVASHLERTTCRNNHCECAPGFTRHGYECSGASAVIVSSSLLTISIVIAKLVTLL